MKAPARIALPSASPRSPEMRHLAHKWEGFVAGKDIDLSDVPVITREAWLRAKQAGIDPATPHAPLGEMPTDPAQLQEEFPWLSCAEPVFALLRSMLTEPHQLLGLTDHHCRILFTYVGNRAKDKAEEIRAIPGGQYGEAEIGCNAVGTVLYTDRPLQMCWQEHYCQNWQKWIAQGAPVHDPISHDILGVLFTAGYGEFCHPRALELVARSAAMIETNLREQEAQARLAVLVQFTRLTIRYPSEALLALDKRGNILALSPAVEKMAPLSPANLIGRSLQDCPGLRERIGPFVLTGSVGVDLVHERGPSPTIFSVSDTHASGAVVLLPHPTRSTPRDHASQSWAATYTFADLVGQSLPFRQCLDLAAKVSQQEWPVLLLGESGTGKELLAQAIHSASPRRYGPFVALSCASISDEMIGSELFGYTEGSFTGALKGGKIGKMQLAHTGTLFLDDIDGMPLKVQLSVLRVLEDNRVVPLGAQKPQPVNIRVIAASNSDLEHAVREGRFRQDLYYRLNVLPVTLPALRERVDDIPLLTRHLLARHAPSVAMTEEALGLLSAYSWPGNVRELRNVLIAASVRAHNGHITPAELPVAITHVTPAVSPGVSLPPLQPLKETEAELIVRALQQTESVSRAASLLGLHHSTLYRKLKKYGIDLPPGREKASQS